MAAPSPHWKRKSTCSRFQAYLNLAEVIETARPCPFYSQGRCLFADSCNFIHSVKAFNELPVDSTELDPNFRYPSSPATRTSVRPSYSSSTYERPDSRHTPSPSSRPSRPPSARSVRSPPRSPRLSGLLYALAPVIGPEPEEEEEEEEEEPLAHQQEGENVNAPEKVFVEHPSVEGESGSGETSLLFEGGSVNENDGDGDRNVLIVPSADEAQPGSLLSPFGASFDGASDVGGFSFLSDFPVPPGSLMNDSSSSPTTSTPPRRSSGFRPKVPPPIITQHDSGGARRIDLDNNALEIYTNNGGPLTPIISAGPQSTFELLSSPFASPAKRAILSPQFPPSNASSVPTSPIFGAFTASASTSTPVKRRRGSYLDDELESPAEVESSSLEQAKEDHYAESDQFHTPKSKAPLTEDHGSLPYDSSDMPPLPSSHSPDNSVEHVSPEVGFLSRGPEEDFTITAVSHFDESPNDSLADASMNTNDPGPTPGSSKSRVLADFASSFSPLEEILGDEEEEPDSPQSPSSPTVRLPHLEIGTYEERDTLNSMVGYYSDPDPSPVPSELYSSRTSETLVESDVSDSLSKGKGASVFSSKRSSYASLSIATGSPQTQKSNRTITHSPLKEEVNERIVANDVQPPSATSLRSVSSTTTTTSSSSSSSIPTWTEVAQRIGANRKIPFGFRHSLLQNDQEAGPSSAPATLSRAGSSQERSIGLPPHIAAKIRQSIQSEPPRSASPSGSDRSRQAAWMRPLRLVSQHHRVFFVPLTMRSLLPPIQHYYPVFRSLRVARKIGRP